MVEAFVSLLGTCFELGVVLVFDFVELGLELFLEVLYVLVILLTLGLDDVFDVLFHFVGMLGDFHPLFLTLFDFGVVALELLLVREANDVLIELVKFAFVIFLLIDDLVEVLFDVEEGVDVGDVVRTFFDVECLVFLGDELLDLVGFVLDLVDNQVAFERVESLGFLGWFFEGDFAWEPVEVLDDAFAVFDAYVNCYGCAAVDDLVHILISCVAVDDVM